MFEHRYDRNLIFTADEQKALAEKNVSVLGAGGLGGYVCEMLARAGVGHLKIFDYDTFSESNLNRQLVSTEKNLGKNKAAETKKRISEINSDTEVTTIEVHPVQSELPGILAGSDLIMDCLDTVRDRLILQDMAKRLGIPLVHGAIGGWCGQVCTVLPGSDTLSGIYASEEEPESAEGNPSFTPAVIAGIQVSEALKYLTGKSDLLTDKVLFVDLLNCDYRIMEL